MRIFTILTLLITALACTAAIPTGHELARFVALARLESGTAAKPDGDDLARGRRDEVSRYQMLPSVWTRRFGKWSPPDFRNPVTALSVAYDEQLDRTIAFQRRRGRPPTDFEWALLWHCPARVFKPTESDRDYMQRFVNILESK